MSAKREPREITVAEIAARQYKTECHRYLYADEGAILTTRKVSCAPCNGTAVPHAERKPTP